MADKINVLIPVIKLSLLSNFKYLAFSLIVGAEIS